MDHRIYTNGNCRLHVRFEGRSWDFEGSQLNISLASTDAEVRQAVAQVLEVPVARLATYVIERYPNGNITLRPQAVFG